MIRCFLKQQDVGETRDAGDEDGCLRTCSACPDGETLKVIAKTRFCWTTVYQDEARMPQSSTKKLVTRICFWLLPWLAQKLINKLIKPIQTSTQSELVGSTNPTATDSEVVRELANMSKLIKDTSEAQDRKLEDIKRSTFEVENKISEHLN